MMKTLVSLLACHPFEIGFTNNNPVDLMGKFTLLFHNTRKLMTLRPHGSHNLHYHHS